MKPLLRLALLATATFLATGCLSYRGGQLPKLEARPKAPAPLVAKVRLDLQVTRNGKPLSAGALSKAALEFHTKLAMQSLTNSGFFGEVQLLVPGTAGWPDDYVVKYEVDNWGNIGAAAASGFICGLTLFVIPGFGTDHFTVQAEVLDHQGKSCWKKKYDDQMTTVIWLGFLPCLFVPPCYPMSVIDKTLNNIYQHSFQDMLADKAFSLPPATGSGTTPPIDQKAAAPQ